MTSRYRSTTGSPRRCRLDARSWPDAFRDHLSQLRDLPPLVRRTAFNVRALIRHRRHSAVSTPVPMLNTPRTSFNGALTSRRSFVTTSLSASQVRAIAATYEATINDVVLAVVSGSLRRYLLDRHELPTVPLVAGVPVTADNTPTRFVGNRVSNSVHVVGDG